VIISFNTKHKLIHKHVMKAYFNKYSSTNTREFQRVSSLLQHLKMLAQVTLVHEFHKASAWSSVLFNQLNCYIIY